MDRREFLKKLWLWLGGAAAISILWKNLYDTITDTQSDLENVELSIIWFKDKPINLGYHQYTEDKGIIFKNMPKEKFHIVSRVSRCLRWKPITDAVEDRYDIPRGLLMAMMAQEWLWDPTMPNLGGDWWLWLIHIQAINAHIFGLKTLPRSTDKMRDTKHGKLIKETLSHCHYNMSKLVEKDDRFHPVMAVDCAARFLVDCRRRAGGGTDSWMHALRKYSGRSYWDYCIKVIRYWAAVNNVTWDKFPKWFSQNVYDEIHTQQKNNMYVKDKLENLSFEIDGENSWYDWYLAYFEESMQNFELWKYIKMWTYEESLKKSKSLSEWNKKIQESKESLQEEKEIPVNTLIQSQFVDTKRHNSQWYRLYRYKVLSWDSLWWISNKFDNRDKQNGDKYAKAWASNIVRYNWNTADNLQPGEVIYLKVRNR